jgi:uncharacterized phage infection (PIP) family protein YhgE
LNIAMLALSIAAGLVSAWWLLPIGLGLWFVMVRGVATHPVTQAQMAQPDRPEVTARFQSVIERIEAGQLRALNAIGETKRPLRQALDPLQTEINRLVDNAHRVAQGTAPLETQRKARAKLDGDLPQEIATIDRQLVEFTNEAIKRNLAKSRANMQTRLDSLQALTDQLDRVQRQFDTVADTLEQTTASLAKLTAGSADSDALTTMVAQVQAQSKALDALMQGIN